MTDPRFDKLAQLLIGHSTSLHAGEHLLIEAFDLPREMTIALVRAARDVGGLPHVVTRDTRVERALLEGAANEALDVLAANDLHRMRSMDAYIGIRGSANVSEMAGVAPDKLKQFGQRYSKPVHFEERVNNTKWCVLRWPTPSMAQLAQMSTEAFEDFYFRVCTLDYSRMAKAMAPLVSRMEAAESVHIQGPGDTDLRFSIKDIPVIPCAGEKNIPDGECFTAPVKDSVEGVIHYNTPTLYHGNTFENVRLRFEKGRVVEWSADTGEEHLSDVFGTDEGARYVGEFSLGFNPSIERAMKDILFDEKIAGSLHFTPGQAYEEADNGNRSEVHWDLVLIQRPEAGGGTISFDGEVIRRDGLFVVDDLAGLNPEALGAG